jgi:predicted anti-sigma-YlaC factor YlaD
MMSCKDITEHASAYLDKEVPFTTRLNMRLHLFMCLHCRRYMDQLQTTIKTLGRMNTDIEKPVDTEIDQHLVECFKKESQRDQKE